MAIMERLEFAECDSPKLAERCMWEDWCSDRVADKASVATISMSAQGSSIGYLVQRKMARIDTGRAAVLYELTPMLLMNIGATFANVSLLRTDS